MITRDLESTSIPNLGSAMRSSELAHLLASTMMALFLIATLTFPVAFANKAIFVLLLGLMFIAPFASAGKVRLRSFSPIIVLGIFLYGYLLALMGQTFWELTNQLVLSAALLFLIYLIDWYAIDLDYLIKVGGIALCLFTGLAIYAVIVVPDSALGVEFIYYFNEYTNQSFGARSFSDTSLFMFRIGPVPFLFLPYCLFLISFLDSKRVRDLIALIVIGAVIVISTSRALIFCCLLASAYLVIRRMRPASQIIAVCAGAAFGILLVSFLTAQTTIFSATDKSNSMKIGHAISFFEHMNIPRFFFGEGLASYYFSMGTHSVETETEITLFDMVRYVGAPLTALLYAALLFPVLRASNYSGENRTVVVIFLIYLVISLTNPVLFNSYGLVIVLWYWSRIVATRSYQA